MSHSTGAVACDIDNDGYQDLYVGAWGNPDDDLGFRSPQEGNSDSLFLNDRAGGFREITQSAFGDAVNIRSATGIACADVNGDGWLDLYVGNLMDDDYRTFSDYNHPGHYNLLYINNGDLTFTEIAEDSQASQVRTDYNDQPGRLSRHPRTPCNRQKVRRLQSSERGRHGQSGRGAHGPDARSRILRLRR